MHFKLRWLILDAPVSLHGFRAGALQVFHGNQTCAVYQFANLRTVVDRNAAKCAIAAKSISFTF